MEENNKPEFGTRNTGMFVPEGFFAEFHKDLERQIDQKEQRSITIRRWSIAASICLILGLIPFAWNLFDKEATAGPQPVMIAETEVEDMNSEEIFTSTISDYDIYEYFYADL